MARGPYFSFIDFDHDFAAMRSELAEAAETLAKTFGPKGSMGSARDAPRAFNVATPFDPAEAARRALALARHGYTVAVVSEPASVAAYAKGYVGVPTPHAAPRAFHVAIPIGPFDPAEAARRALALARRGYTVAAVSEPALEAAYAKGRVAVPTPHAAPRAFVGKAIDPFDPVESARRALARGYAIADAFGKYWTEVPGAYGFRGGEPIQVALEDGAKTTAIIANGMLQGIERALTAGVDPLELRRGISLGTRLTVLEMERHAHRRLTREQIAFVAATAADGDVQIGAALAVGVAELGADRSMLYPAALAERRVLDFGFDPLATSAPFEAGAETRYLEADVSLSRAHTATRAVSAAFDEGVLAGGGAAFLHIAAALERMPANTLGVRAGINIVSAALKAPAERLAESVGLVGENVSEIIRRGVGMRFGFDVVAGRYGDMFEAGVIDPVKTLRVAVQSAGEVAEAFVVAGGAAASGARRSDRVRFEDRYVDDPLPGEALLPSVAAFGWRRANAALPISPMSGGPPAVGGRKAEGLAEKTTGRARTGAGRTPIVARQGSEDGGLGDGKARPAAPGQADDERQPGRTSRHLVGSFPDRVAKESITILNVYVTLTAEGRSAPLDISVPEGGLTIKIVIEASGGFALLGDRHASLEVPADADSNIVGFRLKATGSGRAEIHIEAFNGGTRIGALTLSTFIGTDADAAPTPHSAAHGLPTMRRRDGDAHLTLSFNKEANAYDFILEDDEGSEQAFLKKTLSDVQTATQNAVNKIQAIARDDYPINPQFAKEKIRNSGASLWQELIPEEIRNRFIQNHKKIKRLTILSRDDPFPWELFYPFRAKPRFERGFLIQRVELCRWTYGNKPPVRIPIKRADFVIASDGELHKATEEIVAITALLKARDLAVAQGRIEEATELLALFRKAVVNLLHFACHNSFDDRDCWIVINKTRVHWDDLSTCESRIADADAFIFMNACYSDKKIPKYTSIGGWANAFLRTGAGAFIGTLWEVRDATASLFAKTMYEELLGGKPFGKALRRARTVARRASPGDPTWLAYSFYGDSTARLGDRGA